MADDADPQVADAPGAPGSDDASSSPDSQVSGEGRTVEESTETQAPPSPLDLDSMDEAALATHVKHPKLKAFIEGREDAVRRTSELETQRRLEEANQEWAQREGYIQELNEAIGDDDGIRKIAAKMQGVANRAADTNFRTFLQQHYEGGRPKDYKVPAELENKLLKAKTWDEWGAVQADILMDFRKEKYIEQGRKLERDAQKKAQEVRDKQAAGEQRSQNGQATNVQGTMSNGRRYSQLTPEERAKLNDDERAALIAASLR